MDGATVRIVHGERLVHLLADGFGHLNGLRHVCQRFIEHALGEVDLAQAALGLEVLRIFLEQLLDLRHFFVEAQRRLNGRGGRLGIWLRVSVGAGIHLGHIPVGHSRSAQDTPGSAAGRSGIPTGNSWLNDSRASILPSLTISSKPTTTKRVRWDSCRAYPAMHIRTSP